LELTRATHARCACPSVAAVAQGCQIGMGALLMTVVGGGSPAVGLANPGLGKWLNGAIGLPVVRCASPAAACRNDISVSDASTRACRHVVC
jgi:hypothetical protein